MEYYIKNSVVELYMIIWKDVHVILLAAKKAPKQQMIKQG